MFDGLLLSGVFGVCREKSLRRLSWELGRSSRSGAGQPQKSWGRTAAGPASQVGHYGERMSSDPAAQLADQAEVAAAVGQAREACERLRWHPAMRRRSAQVRAESTVWQAWASARMEGARLPVEVVRAASVGARSLPDDPVGRVVTGAVRAGAEAELLSHAGGRRLSSAPRQAVARLHLVAAEGLAAAGELGRPRADPEAAARLNLVVDLLASSSAPALVVAAIVQAELSSAEPFVTSNAIVARALARAIMVGRGLDPMGAVVPELAYLDDLPGYQAALGGYASGRLPGVVNWLRYVASAVVAGAERGTKLADSVLAGKPLRS